jgi:hypothetical protein
MIIELTRTFSEFQNAETGSVDEDWSRYLSHRQGSRSWPYLHEKPLVVILGEAGIGKTVEFQREVERLRETGQAAFFIPLNQIFDMASWQLVLTGHEAVFDTWAASDELGYFFLDAVDEARLKSHADFERALTVVQRALGSNLGKVRIAISSRITDWSTPGVRLAVDDRLTKPIERARLAAQATTAVPPSPPDSPTVDVSAESAAQVLQAFVVSIDPLSNSDARRCATAFEVEDEQQFWTAVADGDYEFMATRPLDLRWMVVLWNERRTLGTYRELIEANISNRLREFNVSYEAAGEVLSADELHAGATELAAAAEFGGCAFLTLDVSIRPMEGELSPHTVLVGWHPTAVRRLLATAVFDEASFGRVRFHHRSIREFLAAEWVAKQLVLGVPLQRLQGLFASRLFGQLVLIPARRAPLSWLTAINVAAREWVVRDFPEVFLFEGDPQAWDGVSADSAFANFIEKSKHAFQMSWHMSASEYMRTGRVLRAGQVALVLADFSLPPIARSICFQIARHAKLSDCATVSFAIYRDSNAPAWERAAALNALEFIGSANQRQEVLADLKAGVLRTNELIAHALPVTDWTQLQEAELSAVFNSTHNEGAYGSGSMFNVMERELLPAADVSAALLLLRTVMMCLPPPNAGTRFARFPESDQPERSWLLYVLPDCFERVLELLQQQVISYPTVCVQAAERIETLRDSGFTNKEELNRLSKVIAQHQELRWDVALAIAQSEDIQASVNRLLWDGSCLVNFSAVDLPELTRRANEQARPVAERDIWFEMATTLIFSRSRRRERTIALTELVLGEPGSARALRVKNQYDRWRSNAKHQRKWEAEEQERKELDIQALEADKARFLADLENIRNGTNSNLLIRLLNFSFSRSGQRNYSDVDFNDVAKSLSPEIATAFEAGLIACWPTLSPPDPSAYANGTVPWLGLIGLAGVRRSLVDDNSIARLPAANVAKAAQLAVWELNAPPPWFEALVRLRRPEVEAALAPWLVAEAQAAIPGNGVRGALEMVLRCGKGVRAGLILQLAPLLGAGQISRRETLEAVVLAMVEDGTISPAAVGGLCSGKLTSSIGANGHIGEMGWLRIWMQIGTPAAWSWFRGHLQSMTGDVTAEVNSFAAVVADLKWLQTPLNLERANVLLDMHVLLSAHPPAASIGEPDESDFFGPPSKRLRDAIPGVFLGTGGQIGHDYLSALLRTLTNPAERSRVEGQLAEQAALDAAQTANRNSAELKSISSPFSSDPSTEAQLYEQVIGRLEEVRKNLEEGPFSERDLFTSGMPEKFLQRWLAAKFRETQNRRFSVHREEEVDDDNMTDIQLSCPAGNVCIEIKPVDISRSYSANSLTDTLRTQIVGQYLRGSNSSRGILVLMQLDKKRWDIPGGPAGQPFDALVDYLDDQAKSIKRSSARVNELAVFGIRCVV